MQSGRNERWPSRLRRSGRYVIHTPDDPRSSFSILYIFLFLSVLWESVFSVFLVGLAKLHCGATPPSVMVLF